MKTDSVWVCGPLRGGPQEQTILGFDREEPARKAILSGGEPDPDDLPITVYGEYKDAPIKDLPPMFIGAGGWAFTQEIAEPLLQFELGTALILPLRILQNDRKTELFSDRGYHIWLRYQRFEALSPNKSNNLRQNPYDNSQWNLPMDGRFRDGDVAVAKNALDSPAVWSDPALPRAVFFNGNVVEAMRQNETVKYWNLKRCTIAAQ